jgi:hypothetical protein
VNLNETILTPINVNAKQFGKVFSFPVDGPIYAQPLYLPGVEAPTTACTTSSMSPPSTTAFTRLMPTERFLSRCGRLASRIPIQASGRSPRDVDCPFISPEVGITSTLVIDLKTGTLYVLARTKERKGTFSADEYVQRLHALDITTGVEKFGGPVVI